MSFIPGKGCDFSEEWNEHRDGALTRQIIYTVKLVDDLVSREWGQSRD
jgi:hypothetical protein